MNEELQVALAKIIETTVSAKDFCIEQAPDVIGQLLAWKFAVSSLCCAFSLLVLIGCALSTKWCIRECKEEGTLYEADLEGVTFFNIIPLIVGILFIDLTWLQIWIAPKVFLLEYASDFIK